MFESLNDQVSPTFGSLILIWHFEGIANRWYHNMGLKMKCADKGLA